MVAGQLRIGGALHATAAPDTVRRALARVANARLVPDRHAAGSCGRRVECGADGVARAACDCAGRVGRRAGGGATTRQVRPLGKLAFH